MEDGYLGSAVLERNSQYQLWAISPKILTSECSHSTVSSQQLRGKLLQKLLQRTHCIFGCGSQCEPQRHDAQCCTRLLDIASQGQDCIGIFMIESKTLAAFTRKWKFPQLKRQAGLALMGQNEYFLHGSVSLIAFRLQLL